MGQLVDDVTDVITNKKQAKEAASARKKILAQIADDEKAKSNLVKKNLAAQRAKYGASGMTGKGMTEEAVLKRLKNETEEPFEEKKKSNLDKLSKIKNPDKGSLLKRLIKNNLPDFFAPTT